MLYICPEDSANLDIFIKIVDNNGEAITTTHDDADLSIEFIKDSGTEWTAITLVTGTYAGYLSSKFVAVPDSDGLYKLSIPATAINARKSTLLRVTYDINDPQELVLQFVGPKVFPTNWSSLLITSGGKVSAIDTDPTFQINIPPTDISVSGGGTIYIKELNRELVFGANVDIEAIPIVLIIEFPNKLDKLIVPDMDLTKVGTSVSFELPAELTEEVASYNWAIRHETTNVLYGTGSFAISYAPHVDEIIT